MPRGIFKVSWCHSCDFLISSIDLMLATYSMPIHRLNKNDERPNFFRFTDSSLLMPWVTTWSIFLSLAPWQHFSHHTYGKNVPRRIVGHISFHFPFLPAHFYGLKREYLLHYILFRFLYLGKGFQSSVIILPQFITKYFRIRYLLQLDLSNIQV